MDLHEELEGYKALADRLGHSNADLRIENEQLREFVSRYTCGMRPKGPICCEAHALIDGTGAQHD